MEQEYGLQLQARLKPIFEKFKLLVARSVPDVVCTANYLRSSMHYTFLATLAFSRPEYPEVELVVASVECGRLPEAEWRMDIAGWEGSPILAASALTLEEQVWLLSDIDKAAAFVAGFFEEHLEVAVEEIAVSVRYIGRTALAAALSLAPGELALELVGRIARMGGPESYDTHGSWHARTKSADRFLANLPARFADASERGRLVLGTGEVFRQLAVMGSTPVDLVEVNVSPDSKFSVFLEKESGTVIGIAKVGTA